MTRRRVDIAGAGTPAFAYRTRDPELTMARARSGAAPGGRRALGDGAGIETAAAGTARPVALAPKFDGVPQALRDSASWVLWRYERRDGRWTKPPRRARGGYASTTDPATWATFEQARAAYGAGGFDGAGLVLVDALVGVDLDHVLDASGSVEAWAREIVDRFGGAYVERSPGGDGLRIFGTGRAQRCGKGGPGNRLELYDRSSPRYLTITGHSLPTSGDVVDAQPGLDWLHEAHMRRPEPAVRPTTKPAAPAMSDDDVLERARKARNGSKFERLMAGQGGDDASSSDMSLACELAFWSRDPAQIERLMRRSGLRREKWDSGRGGTTWLGQTIGSALELVATHYEPEAARRERQRREAQAVGGGDDAAPPIPEVMALDEMRDRLVFVSDGARVAPRAMPHTALAWEHFRLHARGSTTVEGKRVVPTVELWLSDAGRITAHTLTFRPGHPEFTADPDGVPALNLWRPRPRPASSASVEPFLRHVEYLVPVEAERERFLDWLAHVEQRPGVLPHVHYLMVTPQTGIGRNWLSNFLARVWAGACCLGFDLYGSMHSGFNGGLSRRLLVVVDELKASDSGYGGGGYGQALKAMLTTEHRHVNPKFGRAHVEFNCARWLMLSNNYDALPLEKNDRRVVVVANPTERRPPGYYSELYSLIDDPDFADAVGRWLAARDISGFNPSEPAPLTATKRRAIEASAPELEQALEQLRDGTPRGHALMTATDVSEYLSGECGLFRVPARALAAAYAATGIVRCRSLVWVHGRRCRLVALRDGDAWRDAPPRDLAAQLDRQRR